MEDTGGRYILGRAHRVLLSFNYAVEILLFHICYVTIIYIYILHLSPTCAYAQFSNLYFLDLFKSVPYHTHLIKSIFNM